MSFLALFVTLPTQQSAGRMRVWRALRALGSATLRDGVYLLPDSPVHAQALESIAEDVKSVEGTAAIYCLEGRDEAQGQTLIALFDRQGDYAGLLKAIQAANPAAVKAVRALQREFSALAAIDFFPGEAQRQAEEALAVLQARASGEPLDVAGGIRRLASADFQGRIWATRHHPWVDRLASAWLIQRHIDPRARFVWLADPRLCPPEAVGFDFDGAAFTLAHDIVTLQWASLGVLRDGEAYQIIIEDVTADQGRRIVDYVTDTSFVIPTDFRPNDSVAHVMRWWVIPVRQTGTDEQGDPIWTPAGAASEKRVFTWIGVVAPSTPSP